MRTCNVGCIGPGKTGDLNRGAGEINAPLILPGFIDLERGSSSFAVAKILDTCSSILLKPLSFLTKKGDGDALFFT